MSLKRTGRDCDNATTIPAVLFSGWEVLQEVRKNPTHRARTSVENVGDVLDAVVAILCREDT